MPLLIYEKAAAPPLPDWMEDDPDVRESLNAYAQEFLTDAIPPTAKVRDVKYFTSRGGFRPWGEMTFFDSRERTRYVLLDIDLLHLINWLVIVRGHRWPRGFLSKSYFPFEGKRMEKPRLQPGNDVYREEPK